MAEFNPTDYCTVEMIDGEQHVTLDPKVFLIAAIERIEYVLKERVYPAELVQMMEYEKPDGSIGVKGITNRLDILLGWAKSLPDSARIDARIHRKEFVAPFGYVPFKKRPNIEVFMPEQRDAIQRVWNRGDALENAQGWFLQALRLKIGGSKQHILSGKSESETPKDFYHYQL